MLLNRPDFIAEPDGDLVDAFTSRNEQTRKSVPHRMWRYPFATLGTHAFHERGAKVVTIKPFSVGHVGSEHEGIAETVGLKKHLKFDRKRNRSFFSVFEINRRRFPKIESACTEVEPKRTRFDDFLKPQASMEAAKQDEFEFVSWRFSNKLIAKFEEAKILSSSSQGSRNFHIFDRIAASNSGGVDCPAEEGTHSHDISKRGRVGRAFERFVIEALDLTCRHRRGRRARWQRGKEQEQFVSFRNSAGPRVFLPSDFVRDESVDLANERSSLFERKVLTHYLTPAYRFGEVGRFERDEVSFAVSLNRKPVETAATVNPAWQFWAFPVTHGRRLSHRCCNTFNGKTADISNDRGTIAGDKRPVLVKKALLRRWFRVRVPADPTQSSSVARRRRSQASAQKGNQIAQGVLPPV